MLGFLARLFGKNEPRTPSRPRPVEEDAELAAMRDELSWMFPPDTVVDAARWDKYWQDQVEHRVVGLNDMFVQDGELIAAMRAAGKKNILCVGAGLSLEPHALAAAGFSVDVLDLSPWAVDRLTNVQFDPEMLGRFLEGRSRAEGGSLTCVAGDLMDASLCPGPYDVIVERRTLQLYPDETRGEALATVAKRLSPDGLFFSHCHDGSWRPPGQPRHRNEDWFRKQGWRRWDGAMPTSGPAYWLFMSTG